MKRVSVVFLLLTALMSLNNNIYAQGEAAVTFLQIAPDSRFSALGESGAGLADNSSAIFWNPAGIAFLTGQEVSITHSNWLPEFHLDLFYDYATYRNYIEPINGSVTASITYMNYGEFVRTGENDPTPLGSFHAFDMALTLGYATKLSSDWGLGVNFRLIHSNLSDQPTANEQGSGVATTVSFDVAGMWRPSHLYLPFLDDDFGNRFSIGANLSNMGPKIFYIDKAQADPIPTNLRVGLAARLYQDELNSFTYTLDFSKLLVQRVQNDTNNSSSSEWYQALYKSWTNRPLSEEIRDIVSTMGVEYTYGQPGDFLFSLRGGFFYEDPSFGNRKFITLGAGIKYDLYGFDFSYISTSVFKDRENHPLSNTLRFTFSVGWDSVPEKSLGLPRGL